MLWHESLEHKSRAFWGRTLRPSDMMVSKGAQNVYQIVDDLIDIQLSNLTYEPRHQFVVCLVRNDTWWSTDLLGWRQVLQERKKEIKILDNVTLNLRQGSWHQACPQKISSACANSGYDRHRFVGPKWFGSLRPVAAIKRSAHGNVSPATLPGESSEGTVAGPVWMWSQGTGMAFVLWKGFHPPVIRRFAPSDILDII